MSHSASLARALIAATCILLTMGGAHANIYLDEDFEGASAFVDRGFPITNEADEPASPLLQGINLRAWDASETYTRPKVSILTNQGGVVSDRAYRGTRSYRLDAGETLAVKPGEFPSRNTNWFRFWQFAVSADASALTQPKGTRIGHFGIDFSNDSTTDLTPDVTVAIDLVVNASGTADIICRNNGSTLGALSGAANDWALVSIISMWRIVDTTLGDTTNGWAAYEPAANTYKGPQPPPYPPLIQTGIHIYVNQGENPTRVTHLTRAEHLGANWGHEDGNQGDEKQDTAEIGWRFMAENGGAIYLDNLYWDSGGHQSLDRGLEHEQAARMEQFASDTAPPLDPGVASSIKTIYVIGHEHMDIGFDSPPETMKDWCKTHIDTQIAYARTRPAFKWNIEDTWDLQNWIDRSTPAQIDELMGMIRKGQFSVGAAHSSLHTSKSGIEGLNRLLWNSRRYREEYGIPVDTFFQDDVPGATWALPQVLARSGIKYGIFGQNMFIGGGFTRPYFSYVFYWEGPDGSRILSRATDEAYPEGLTVFGIPYGTASNATIDQNKLTAALNRLTSAGYPYDAVLVQHAHDAILGVSQAQYNAINTWNANHDNPKFILATPREFFKYMEGKYGGQIPVVRGNWTTVWDTAMVFDPQSNKIARNAQSDLPATEKMWSIAEALGLGEYPAGEFDNAWDMIQVHDEHSGAGPCWPGYYTQAQVDAENAQYWGYNLSLQASTSVTHKTAVDALLGAAAEPGSDSIVVYNPLSWTRSDLASVPVSAGRFTSSFTLIDPETSQSVPYQKDSRTSSVLFVAPNIPPTGYKRFQIVAAAPAMPESSLIAGSNFLESDHYRIELDAKGYIASITDKQAGRELVNSASRYDFNRAIVGLNSEWFSSIDRTVPDPAAPIVAVGMNGPVAASLMVRSANHPIAGAEIILYNSLDRIDITDTVDRDQTEYAPYTVNSVYYALTFPFNLAGFTVRVNTPAGWLEPNADCIPGSYRGAFVSQYGYDLSEKDYGIMFAARDVFVHAFNGFQTPGGAYPPAEATVVSTYLRKVDESQLKGGLIGTVPVEPTAPRQWDIRYSVRPHAGAFDSTRETRFGAEFATPLRGREVPASAAGLLTSDSLSFLSLDAPNVLITDVKKATFGEGVIIKLAEIGGQATSVTLRSGFFRILDPIETNLMEDDLSPLQQNGPQAAEISLGPNQIRAIRTRLDWSTSTRNPLWRGYW